MSSHAELVIVGASHAGVSLAAAAREAGFTASITLLSAEDAFPYHRPPLSKAYIEPDASAAGMMLRAPEFYDEAGIELRRGCRAEEIDIEHKRLQLADGTTLSYDTLALATGTRPRTLPCLKGLEAVVKLRTLPDADELRQRLAAAREVAVVGGGYIGLEVAAALEKGNRHRVTIVEAAPRLAPRAMSAWSGQYIRERHAAMGAHILLGRRVVDAEAEDGTVKALRLDNGDRVATDLVLVGIGVVPNSDIAERAGIACHDGILVDRNLRTSVPDIYALGDCSAVLREERSSVRFECIQNATDGARRLAALLVGRSDDRPPIPWFWTEQFGLRIQTAGLVAQASKTVLRGDAATGRFSVWCYDAGDVLAGVEAFNAPAEHMLTRRMLSAGRWPTQAQAADLGFDLRTVLS